VTGTSEVPVTFVTQVTGTSEVPVTFVTGG